MLRSFLKIALRNLFKSKAYTFINMLGLSIGMASCLLILLFVRDELSYDRYNTHADRIFRVTREWFNSDGSSSLHLGHVAPPIAPLLQSDFPQISAIARLLHAGDPIIRAEGKVFQENRFFFADPDFLKIFSFDFTEGSAETALQAPNSVVLSESMAAKYFGAAPAIGRILRFKELADLKVTAVIRDMPASAHFHADFIGSIKAVEAAFGDAEFTNWGSNNYATYLLFEQGYDAGQFAAEIPGFIGRHHPDGKAAIPRTTLHLQKLTDIHLRSHLDSEIEANGDIIYVYIFTTVALFLLAIACINFINLATARSAKRAREVALRKVVGAHRRQLVAQFLGESTLLAVFSLAIALGLIMLVLPRFNAFTGKALSFNVIAQPGLIAGLLGIILIVGVAAGGYPAFYLSRFQPALALKSNRPGGTKSVLRQVLVIFQFAISITLLVGVRVVQKQLDYCRTKDLGFTREQLLVLPIGPEIIGQYSNVKSQLLEHPLIVSAAGSKRVPSARLLDSSGASTSKDEQESPLEFRIANIRVDHDFIKTYGMQITAGRDFSTDFPTDSTAAFILNQTAVRRIGWASDDEAVGKPFRYGRRQGTIIGVVKDFHYESLRQPITPAVLMIAPQNFNSLTLRLKLNKPGDFATVLQSIESKWRQFRPNAPFTYSFIDERLEQLYTGERKLEQTFTVFSALAVFIACLGLLGLASYVSEQRTKEIGIRKTLGASAGRITLLLSQDFARLVVFSTFVAWPLAYFAMERWLQAFAYRINLNLQFGSFALAAVTALLIALATVSFHAVKAALTNPIEALRYE